MLVLTRKEDESIQIGPDIRITVVKIAGTTVRIGIEAPSDIKIIRSELTSETPSAPRPSDVQR